MAVKESGFSVKTLLETNRKQTTSENKHHMVGNPANNKNVKINRFNILISSKNHFLKASKPPKIFNKNTVKLDRKLHLCD